MHRILCELRPGQSHGSKFWIQAVRPHGGVKAGKTVYSATEVCCRADISDTAVPVIDQMRSGGPYCRLIVNGDRFLEDVGRLTYELNSGNSLKQSKRLGFGRRC